MDNTRRLLYLEAMEIDVWTPKKDLGVSESGTERIDKTNSDGHVDKAFTIDKPLPPQNDNSLAALKVLSEQVAVCNACSLHETRTRTVFGKGNSSANWLLIGEAPGQSEDLQGEPFVGKAGQLLTEMLRAINLNRDEVFVTNILKCRPPNNRDPKKDEIAACHEFLQQQINLIQPKIILAIGRVAAQQLLNTDTPIGKLRGKIHYLEKIPIVVTYHPAYLLRSLKEKRKAWQDLQMAIKTYKNL